RSIVDVVGESYLAIKVYWGSIDERAVIVEFQRPRSGSLNHFGGQTAVTVRVGAIGEYALPDADGENRIFVRLIRVGDANWRIVHRRHVDGDGRLIPLELTGGGGVAEAVDAGEIAAGRVGERAVCVERQRAVVHRVDERDSQ